MPASVNRPPSLRLSRSEWRTRARQHAERVAAPVDSWLARRGRGHKHPVEDFLFTYYRFPPGKLRQWLPPLGVSLEVHDDDLADHPHFLTHPQLRAGGGEVWLDPDGPPQQIRKLAAWIASLCRQILDRPPRFRCHGLHEWAMVYRQSAEQVRHQGFDLRLPPAQLAAFVESQTLSCTHYDAFRFFTPGARPLNTFQPSLESRPDLEQGACLHANMDLYKWSAKLWPWIGSDLVGQAFALALEGRALDMRASPYDLAQLGFDPIPIETPEGRAAYEAAQRDLSEKARPLRAELARAAAALGRD